MKKIKKIVALALLVAMLMPVVVSAVSSTSYGERVTMYAPDGRQAVVYAGEVEKWKVVGWYDQPVSVSKSQTNNSNSSCYPNTTIPSFDSYGTFLNQSFTDKDKIVWIYSATVGNSNEYLSLLTSKGFVLFGKEDLGNNITGLAYYNPSTNELVIFAYDYKYSRAAISY